MAPKRKEVSEAPVRRSTRAAVVDAPKPVAAVKKAPAVKKTKAAPVKEDEPAAKKTKADDAEVEAEEEEVKKPSSVTAEGEIVKDVTLKNGKHRPTRRSRPQLTRFGPHL